MKATGILRKVDDLGHIRKQKRQMTRWTGIYIVAVLMHSPISAKRF